MLNSDAMRMSMERDILVLNRWQGLNRKAEEELEDLPWPGPMRGLSCAGPPAHLWSPVPYQRPTESGPGDVTTAGATAEKNRFQV